MTSTLRNDSSTSGDQASNHKVSEQEITSEP